MIRYPFSIFHFSISFRYIFSSSILSIIIHHDQTKRFECKVFFPFQNSIHDLIYSLYLLSTLVTETEIKITIFLSWLFLLLLKSKTYRNGGKKIDDNTKQISSESFIYRNRCFFLWNFSILHL